MSAHLVPARFDALMQELFGAPTDSIAVIEQRARRAFGELPVVIWEGDPETFQFEFVSEDAERILGYPASRWTTERTFWVDHVVHPIDRDDAVAYCALATGKGADHCFEYRAIRADGSTVWLRDIVRVVLGARGLPTKLRGVMFDITAENSTADAERRRQMEPSIAELQRTSP